MELPKRKKQVFRRSDTVSLLPKEQTFPIISGVHESELVSLVFCFSVNFSIVALGLFS